MLIYSFTTPKESVFWAQYTENQLRENIPQFRARDISTLKKRKKVDEDKTGNISQSKAVFSCLELWSWDGN